MLIRLDNIVKRYRRGADPVVSGVSLSVNRGETACLFGESGSGKTTLGQIAAGLLRPTEGTVFFEDAPLAYPYRGEPRRRIQLLFQHPEVAFNPKLTLLESMKEPYRLLKKPFAKEALLAHLERFGVYEEHLGRRPQELSGGELQRLALARTMLMEPSFVVLDEPTSMLDVISQAQVVRLLKKLQQERGLGYLFISHDLALCRFFSDRIYPLENGHLLPAAEGRADFQPNELSQP